MTSETIHTDSAFYSILGQKIREARKTKGFDQESFGLAIGLSRPSVINIEKGRQRPSIYQLWLMARILELSFEELIPPVEPDDQLSYWQSQIEGNDQIIDESQKKSILNFISATRIIR
jgi:transcriptional regulator with XRE-family HTH domain